MIQAVFFYWRKLCNVSTNSFGKKLEYWGCNTLSIESLYDKVKAVFPSVVYDQFISEKGQYVCTVGRLVEHWENSPNIINRFVLSLKHLSDL